jgi:hypothetical protein
MFDFEQSKITFLTFYYFKISMFLYEVYRLYLGFKNKAGVSFFSKFRFCLNNPIDRVKTVC